MATKAGSTNIKEQAENIVLKIKKATQHEDVLSSIKSLITLSKHFMLKLTNEQISVLLDNYGRLPIDSLYIAICDMTNDLVICALNNSEENQSKEISDMILNKNGIESLLSLTSSPISIDKALSLLKELLKLSPEKSIQIINKQKHLKIFNLLTDQSTKIDQKEKILEIVRMLAKNETIKQIIRENKDFKCFLEEYFNVQTKTLVKKFEVFRIVLDTFFEVFFNGFKDKNELSDVKTLQLLFTMLKSLTRHIEYMCCSNMVRVSRTKIIIQSLLQPIRLIRQVLSESTKSHLVAIAEAHGGGMRSLVGHFLNDVNFLGDLEMRFTKSVKEGADKMPQAKDRDGNPVNLYKELLLLLELTSEAKREYLAIVSKCLELSSEAKEALVEIGICREDSKMQSSIIWLVLEAVGARSDARDYEQALEGYFKGNKKGQTLGSFTFPVVKEEVEVMENKGKRMFSFGEILLDKIENAFFVLSEGVDNEEIKKTMKNFNSAIRILGFLLEDNEETKRTFLSVALEKTGKKRNLLTVLCEMHFMCKDNSEEKKNIKAFLNIWLPFGGKLMEEQTVEEKGEPKATEIPKTNDTQSKLTKSLLKAFNKQKIRIKTIETENLELSKSNVEIRAEKKRFLDVCSCQVVGKGKLEGEQSKEGLGKLFEEVENSKRDVEDLLILVGQQTEEIKQLKSKLKETELKE